MSSPSFDVMTQSLLIRAGAGAGKTTTLIRTFIELCEHFNARHNRLPRVAITTFTRKATQEVKERLSVKALERNDEKLFQHINKKSHVHISTIHGLLTMLVQENADVLGLPQGIKIIDQNLYKKNLKKVIRNCLKKENSFLEILEHYSFIRLVDFVLQGLEAIKQDPDMQFISEAQLEATSSDKRKSLNDALISILENGFAIPESWQNYFNYLKQMQVLLEQGDIEQILAFYDEKPKKPAFSKKKPPFDQEINDQIENFWDAFDLSSSDTKAYFQSHQSLNSLFFKLVHQVFVLDQEQKNETGEITINDLELFSLQLVRNHPDAVAEFSQNFDYYMIDEFQDTSPIQVEILDAIIKNKPHFIVGDPQQSIYLFRGARSEVFLEKQALAESADNSLNLKFLDTNYRSQPSLMFFINDYFQKVSPQFQPMKVNPEKELTSSKITFIQAAEESAAVLGHIVQLLKSGVSPKNICVLSRRNANLLKIAGLAHKAHIPVQLQISAGFDQKREILDLIAMLKFLVNPHDNENLILLLRSPWAYLTDLEISSVTTSVKLQEYRSLWLTLNQLKANTPVVHQLMRYLEAYQKVGVSEALIQFVKASGFLDFSSAYDSSGKREANFWKLFTHLKQSEGTAGFSLGRFIAENFQFLQSDLGSSQSEAIPVSQPDRVSLMTIHASKGLEFDHVIVVGFSEQPLLTLYQPLAINFEQKKMSLAPFVLDESKSVVSRWAQTLRQNFNTKEQEEHERMLYVALTRARLALTLVAETKSRQSSSSWQKKSFWPEVGTYDEQKYDLVSVNVNDQVDAFARVKPESTPIKSKLNLASKVLTKVSVTDSLTSGLTGDNSSETNFDTKITDLLRAKKGTDLHRIFESLQLYAKNEGLLNSLQYNFSSEEKKSIDYLLNQTQLPLKELITQGFAEWGFGIKTKNGVLQGQIDLWGVVGDDIYILDYKTGRSTYAEKAYQQLVFYAACLYRMKMIATDAKLNLVVVYPLEQKTLVRTYDTLTEFTQIVPEAVSSLF
ncbi:MAG: UvrD-helicase domain-containing protein [Bdellovibrio sp.]|nr:UvrD-helicase domain-containing protein [Bdellovibrio sp.]